MVMPPYSSFSPITPDERKALMTQSIVAGVYEQEVDRDSAYEMLQRKVADNAQQIQAQAAAAEQAKQQAILAKEQEKQQAALAKEQEKQAKLQAKEDEKVAAARAKLTQDVLGTFAKSAARSLGGSTGQKLVRGLLGSLFGGR